MKWPLCIALIFVLTVHSKPINHGALGPEIECLKQYMDIIDDIMKEVHSITPPENEAVGEYVVCYLKKRQILEDNGEINADNIYKYWSEVYYTTISSDSEEKQLRDAAAECAKLTAPNLPILGLKIKNCLLEGARKLPFVG
ncbi:hypothetical protein PPYR_00911 [Photinus pyralis]|uniref:Uncharacterized protein n=1 Tax=Photinus pyralis TaxID=7054 RepID=A0A1Y1NI38_PHOPY|nr:uncharacterized protein LOC116160374 [Photinus pyralis]KAB0803941.1 hypothetical protein PPYR_00911 [Photinus pyralis]